LLLLSLFLCLLYDFVHVDVREVFDEPPVVCSDCVHSVSERGHSVPHANSIAVRITLLYVILAIPLVFLALHLRAAVIEQADL
jgi:hypothetical protein